MPAKSSQYRRRILRLVALAIVAQLAALGCRPGRVRAPRSEPNVVVESGQPPSHNQPARPEVKWTSEKVLRFLLDTEREIDGALPYPEWDEPLPPFVGQCRGADKRGYWKTADVLPVLDKRMTPAMRACRMVAFGCVIGPWIGRHSGGPVFLPYVGSKVTMIDVSADRVVADVQEGDNDDVLGDSTLNTNVIGLGWEPTVSRYVIERGTDGVWRIADKTNLWNDGDCDEGPVILYPTPSQQERR